jgi:pyruvate-ferredoxin/flavodoxin oxidoreductase
MKEAAKKSYGKKGDAVVEMNYKAIDAGLDALHEVTVPESWKNPAPDAMAAEIFGRPAVVNMVKTLMEPIAKMDGDSLPVSAFKDCADGQFELGASAYEKRGVAVSVPQWDPEKCIQCNQCAFVCSHATIRPFALTKEEVEKAPSTIRTAAMKGKEYLYTMAVSPLDCMGCGECVTVCPKGAIQMVPQEAEAAQQPVFDYCVENIRKKPGLPADTTVIGSQFNQPLLEFSGSCAGCAETSYARLVTQMFGEQMYISNATGCSSIWGNPAATAPYTVNKESGHGPAWANSLFEDNAEHGFGMYLGQKVLREQTIAKVVEMASSEKASAEFKAAAEAYLATKDDTKKNSATVPALVAELEKAASEGCPVAPEILANKQYLSKKSVWIFGGDGWAYDIGFGGLDHVLASGENVNVFVFDTEMYSNTGGQASKASNIGEVCQFAAAGKEIGKKSLSEIAMSYGYVYVAQIALGANPAQALKAINEAEAYNGPSLIIGYAPCELHGIKGGMTNCQNEMKKAVKAGYWNLFTFNPALKAEGKNPFTLTSKEGDGSYQEFLNNETRYSRLTKAFPDRAKELFAKSDDVAKARYEHLMKLVELYK